MVGRVIKMISKSGIEILIYIIYVVEILSLLLGGCRGRILQNIVAGVTMPLQTTRWGSGKEACRRIK